MRTEWASLEGQVVRGGYPLVRLLASSERSAVFLSHAATMTPSEVAVKLVPIVSAQAEALPQRWQAAVALDHPNLLRVYEVGEVELGGQRYVFAVMEHAEQNLAQLLEHRALVPDEVREMLGPMLNALEFLHGSQRVHGRLSPPNVLVVGDQVKLSSDTIGPASDVKGTDASSVGLSPYLPPEATGGARSTAGDIWALGVTICEALSQRKPAGLHAVGGGIALPSDIPAPFSEMISKCLSRRPEDRPDVAGLRDWMEGGEVKARSAAVAATTMPAAPMPRETAARTEMPAPVPQDASTRTAVATPSPQDPSTHTSVSTPQDIAAHHSDDVPPTSPIRLVIRAELVPPDESPTDPTELKPQWRLMRVIGAAVVLLAIVGAGIYFFAPSKTTELASTPTNSQAPADSPAPANELSEAPAATLSTPAAQPPASARADTAPADSAAADSAPGGTSPDSSSSAVNEVMPVVPRSASQTIRGTVRVSVRVIVDEKGDVIAAASENAGPSRYFERLSLQAAKQWTFVPADGAGRRLMLVRFAYTRSGVTAKSSPIR